MQPSQAQDDKDETVDLDFWRGVFDAKAAELFPAADPSHDILHVRRVAAMAEKLARAEGADLRVVLPAAYFHDFVNVPKNDPRRAQASRLSAGAAVAYLQAAGYPARYHDAIAHAIAAHSFSAGIAPQTVEAQVVQDADRLDALGAIGTARLFTVSGLLGRPYYDGDDMMARQRAPDDGRYAVDHYFVKLFKVAETLQTPSARRAAQARVGFMKSYLAQLADEVSDMPLEG
jgi:uncharacterized protein